MMDVGTHVRVTEGEHHGKTGEIVRVESSKDSQAYTVTPVVLLSTGLEIAISGKFLTPIR